MKETIGFSDFTRFALSIANVLKWRFPATVFLVTLGRPIQGFIYVHWTDGPTKSLVNDVLFAFLVYKDQEQQWEQIETGRDISPRFAGRFPDRRIQREQSDRPARERDHCWPTNTRHRRGGWQRCESGEPVPPPRSTATYVEVAA